MRNRHASDTLSPNPMQTLLNIEHEASHPLAEQALYQRIAELVGDVHDLIHLSITSRALYNNLISTQYPRLETHFYDKKEKLLKALKEKVTSIEGVNNIIQVPLFSRTLIQALGFSGVLAYFTSAIEMNISVSVALASFTFGIKMNTHKMNVSDRLSFSVLVMAEAALVLLSATFVKNKTLVYFKNKGEIANLLLDIHHSELQALKGRFDSHDNAILSLKRLSHFVDKLEDKKTREHNARLFLACKRGDLSAVTLLLENKTLTALDSFHHLGGDKIVTPLIVAAAKNHTDIVKVLLSAGANPNQKVPLIDITPLMAASQCLSVESVKILLEAGACVFKNIPENTFFSPLLYFSANYAELLNKEPSASELAKMHQIIALMLNVAIREMKSMAQLNAALRVAILHGQYTLINALCEAAAHKKLQGEIDQQILIECIINGKSEAAIILLNLYSISQNHKKTLNLPHALLFRSHDRIRKPVRENKLFNVNHVIDHGFTPLITAAFYNRAEIVTALAIAGANLNHAARNGMTALLLAVKFMHIETVSALIAAGADLHLRDADGLNALDYAHQFKRISDDEVHALAARDPHFTFTPNERRQELARLIEQAAGRSFRFVN